VQNIGYVVIDLACPVSLHALLLLAQHTYFGASLHDTFNMQILPMIVNVSIYIPLQFLIPTRPRLAITIRAFKDEI
jgi:hypothetical protein